MIQAIRDLKNNHKIKVTNKYWNVNLCELLVFVVVLIDNLVWNIFSNLHSVFLTWTFMKFLKKNKQALETNLSVFKEHNIFSAVL